METLRVQISFTGLRDADLGTTGQTILSHMTGNEAFTDLASDITLVQTAHVDYMQSLAPGPKAGALANAIKAECRKALASALHDLGVKINLKAKGNQPLLESTGYPLVRFGGHRRREKKAIELEAGVRCVAVAFKAIEGAGAYLVQYTEAPVTGESAWRLATSKKTVTVVNGLETGKRYAFRIAGIIDGGEPVYSEPAVSKFVE